jgi:hypothetical protein
VKEIRTYAELQERMRKALREQHPEWLEPSGDSPICHAYEKRFAELLALFTTKKAVGSYPKR